MPAYLLNICKTNFNFRDHLSMHRPIDAAFPRGYQGAQPGNPHSLTAMGRWREQLRSPEHSQDLALSSNRKLMPRVASKDCALRAKAHTRTTMANFGESLARELSKPDRLPSAFGGKSIALRHGRRRSRNPYCRCAGRDLDAYTYTHGELCIRHTRPPPVVALSGKVIGFGVGSHCFEQAI